MAKRKRKKDNSLDPFGFLADRVGDLIDIDEEDIWEEKPVGIQEFIESPEFLDLKFSPKNNSGCRPIIMEVAIEITQPNVREAMLILGKGCLADDTIIRTNYGLKRMEELALKVFKVESLDENKILVENYAMCLPRGRQVVNKYVFSNGSEIEATKNHKFPTTKGVTRASDLALGDKFYTSNKINDVLEVELVEIDKGNVLKQTYDILCDSPNHNFVANEIVTSNSGKDFIASILHSYGIYKCLCMKSPQKVYGLSPGSPIYFVNTARNDNQAKKVFFKEFLGMIEHNPWFEGRYDDPGIQNISFDKGIEALSANSQAYGWLGFNTLQWVGDELAFFLENDKDDMSESRAEECWQAAYGSCQTRFPNHFKMIGITTPNVEEDFVMHKAAELQERMKTSKDAYFRRAATWDVNPALTKESFKHELKRNYRRAMRDFGAVATGSMESFWADSEIFDESVNDICKKCSIYIDRKVGQDVYACYDNLDCLANGYAGNCTWKDWFYGFPESEYWMHFDLSISGDRLGWCLGHKCGVKKLELDEYKIAELREANKSIPDDYTEERPIIAIDAASFIYPHGDRESLLLKKNEIYFDGLLKHLIYPLKERGFNIVGVTFDRFQSHHIKQTLDDKGYMVELVSCDRTDEIPAAAKIAVVEGRVIYPYNRMLSKEGRQLQYIGKKVDHPKNGSKDVWDSFASVIHDCENAETSSGSFVALG